MAFDPPYSTGIFETITNVHFGLKVYVIIVAGHNAFAVPTSDTARVVAQTLSSGGDNDVQPSTGVPFSMTLLECDANVGDNMCELRSTYFNGGTGAPDSGSVDYVFGFVCPHVDEVLQNWTTYASKFLLAQGQVPPFPHLWTLGVMFFGSPAVLRWKIRNVKGAADIRVQLYPMTGATSWAEGNLAGDAQTLGWFCYSYRLNKSGGGATFTMPPGWRIAPILVFVGQPPSLGIPFGTDPPPAGDMPF